MGLLLRGAAGNDARSSRVSSGSPARVQPRQRPPAGCGCARRLLASLAARAPLLPGKDVLAYLDIDACQRRVYGGDQAGRRVRRHEDTGQGRHRPRPEPAGLRPVHPHRRAADLRGPAARRVQTNCTRGAASFLREQISTARDRRRHRRPGGPDGLLAYYNGKAITACRDLGACFSVTMRMDPKVRRRITQIPDDQRAAIKYPHAIWDEYWKGVDLGCRGRRVHLGQGPHRHRPDDRPAGPPPQPQSRSVCQILPGMPDEITYRYHPVFTDSPHPMLAAQKKSTATTPSASRASPTSSTARWPTCRMSPGQPSPGCGARCSPPPWPPGCTSSPPRALGEEHWVRARGARRQGHDRDPAVAADRRPRSADPPRPATWSCGSRPATACCPEVLARLRALPVTA